MVICFEISERTKKELDQLLDSGDFSDYSEVVTVAVANQLVLQEQSSSSESTMIDRAAGTVTSRLAKVVRPKREMGVPSFFTRNVIAESNIRPIAPSGDVFVVGEAVPVDRWIFGQHNKLFTVKASCRGLARLLYETPTGVVLVKAAAEIAGRAAELGDFLRGLDEKHHYGRGEALATAFPKSGSENYKALLRYSNQFVASMNKNGQLSGLLSDLKMINVLGSKRPRISLTEVGLNFVKLSNPILDGNTQGRGLCRFSKEEIEFLLAHIRASVPAEIFAFRAILTSLVKGNQSPESLDQALARHVSGRNGKLISKGFIATQRSGSISRMVELGLVSRVREGVKVKYEPTEAGISYLNG